MRLRIRRDIFEATAMSAQEKNIQETPNIFITKDISDKTESHIEQDGGRLVKLTMNKLIVKIEKQTEEEASKQKVEKRLDEKVTPNKKAEKRPGEKETLNKMEKISDEKEAPKQKVEKWSDEKEASKQKAEKRSEDKEATKQKAEKKSDEKEALKQKSEKRSAEKEATTQKAEKRSDDKEVTKQKAKKKSDEKEALKQKPEKRSDEKEALTQNSEKRSAEKEAPTQKAEKRSDEKETLKQKRENRPDEKQAPKQNRPDEKDTLKKKAEKRPAEEEPAPVEKVDTAPQTGGWFNARTILIKMANNAKKAKFDTMESKLEEMLIDLRPKNTDVSSATPHTTTASATTPHTSTWSPRGHVAAATASTSATATSPTAKTNNSDFDDDSFIPEITYSNNMRDAIQSVCQICGQIFTWNNMRGHTRRMHDITITDYKVRYGPLIDHVVEEVFHRCGICNKAMLLDGDYLKPHAQSHKMSLKEYSSQYLVLKDFKEVWKCYPKKKKTSINVTRTAQSP